MTTVLTFPHNQFFWLVVQLGPSAQCVAPCTVVCFLALLLIFRWAKENPVIVVQIAYKALAPLNAHPVGVPDVYGTSNLPVTACSCLINIQTHQFCTWHQLTIWNRYDAQHCLRCRAC